MTKKDLLAICTALLECVLFSGVIIGWPNLQQVLLDSNYFQGQCTGQALVNVSLVLSPSLNGNTSAPCKSQQESFNLVFTLSVSALSLAAFPLGHILDKYGTWVMRSVATFLYTAAYVCLSCTSSANSWILFPSMISISVAGLALLISNFQLSALTSSCRSLYVTVVNGMYDASSLVYLVVKLAYDGGTPLKTIFYVMTGSTVFLWLRTFLVMPRMMTRSKKQKRLESISKDVLIASSDQPSVKREGSEGLKRCLRVPTLWTNVFHFSLTNLQMGFYVGTLVSWLDDFLSPSAVESYTNIFGALLIAGAVVAPLNGLLTDGMTTYYKRKVASKKARTLRGFCVSATCTSLLGVALAACTLGKQVVPSFIFLVIFRSFIAGGNASFMALTFPQKHFGKLYGICQTVAGLVALLQYAMFKLAVQYSFTIVHASLLVSSTLTLIHPYAVYRHSFRCCSDTERRESNTNILK